MTSRERDITQLRLAGATWRLRRDDLARTTAWLQAHFPEILERNENLLKDDTGSRVAAAEGLVVKESTARRGRSALRFGLRRSGARHAFRLGGELNALGISTPRPVAWATVRRLGLRVKDYFVAERVESCSPLKDTLDACRENAAARSQMLDLLGRLLASFHVNGVSNRDMKDTNILVNESGGTRLWVVDLDGARKKRFVTRRRAMRDFWPIIRSLKTHGLGGEADRADLLRGYNAVVPERLRFKGFPASYG
jgi:tRNA A-37 threonylcarbamoyl transferase component Bud32